MAGQKVAICGAFAAWVRRAPGVRVAADWHGLLAIRRDSGTRRARVPETDGAELHVAGLLQLQPHLIEEP
jgi:hypothetical protein